MSDEDRLASGYDELPLWSAPFGLALLDEVELRPGITALDVGCGTGFPLIELAARLGPRSRVHGVDPWAAAVARARFKVELRGMQEQVVLHEVGAESLPLADRSVDLVVSCNGFNNVADPGRAAAECARVARAGAQLVYAYNLPGTMEELYAPLVQAMLDHGVEDAAGRVQAHRDEKRWTLSRVIDLFERAGFALERCRQDRFTLRYADPEALLHHPFVRLAFLPSWEALIPGPARAQVVAQVSGALPRPVALSIPFACLSLRRRAGEAAEAAEADQAAQIMVAGAHQ